MANATQFELYDPFFETTYRFPALWQTAQVAVELGLVIEVRDDRPVRWWWRRGDIWVAETEPPRPRP